MENKVDIFCNDYPQNSIFYALAGILATVESNFGKREPSYTILGIELCNQGPQLFFPYNIEKGIIIWITEDCRFDIVQAVYQVAHEVVHCLRPTLFGESTYLEEGLATYFAHQYTNQHYGAIGTSDPKYKKASDLAQRLLEYKPSIIKELRISEPSMSLFTKEMILSHCPDMEELAIKLTTNFQIEL